MANSARQQTTEEILKKVRRIEIHARRLVNDLFSGEYHSIFKGRGMEFAEVRSYVPGDDIRTIDWNVTARTGEPHVKLFNEERELTIMLLVDLSGSADFGTVSMTKKELATEISAVLAFSAIKNNDRVGLLIFTDRAEIYIPPKKGRKHVLRVVREILRFEPVGHRTDIGFALEFLSRMVKRRCVAFLISDFIAEDFDKTLGVAGRRFDLIPICLNDPREEEVPPMGMALLEDAETGETVWVDTRVPAVRKEFSKRMKAMRRERDRMFMSMNMDHINLSTSASYIEPLRHFFRKRAKKAI